MLQEIKTEVVTITPEIAEKWLEGNVHNRPISERKANDYAKEMMASKWRVNGEPIIFDWNGMLVDGQHRLWAAIYSKSTFTSLVVRGVNPDTFSTIDTGKARTAGDVLGIDKIKDPNYIAAVVQYVLRYLDEGPRGGSGLRGTTKIPNADVSAFVALNPSLVEWAQKVKKGEIRSWAALVAAVLFLASKNKSVQAEDFANKIVTGENLPGDSPILLLRNKVINSHSRKDRTTKMAMVIRAWNAFATGRVIKALPYLKKDEKAPRIVGAEN